ncbi:ABC transporter ATP-binding protein [Clostridiaceae bacterium NSJ-31]|uniref:ABC transporter ATP-binding protein n=1 Tax=Ligaoa zhengdingensis TaxID=2763658 RepID=A0A926I530_9FIRM|nr:ATP-binding cassette domain-containing protein [Ligaoa zhengdingensis]MBC8547025.1 ABC transporter ATP-binding protein [Ligaoa zhengdingensis]
MLQLTNVGKTFNAKTPNAKVALRNINLTLEDGDFVTIIGGNGAGKSTLFNAIAGAFLCDTGRIYLDGQDYTFLPEYKRARCIGRLFQDPMRSTAPSMTIEENLALCYQRGTRRGFGIGVKKSDVAYFRDRLAELGLGLEDRLKTKMGLLSGGQRQAVTLLMATIVTPRLLLLDEHTAALDPATAVKVLEMTDRIVKKDHITTMMITHNIQSALELGNRTIMMDEGEIILDLKGEERENMTVEKLIDMFSQKRGKKLDNDRMLLV